jgi:hypothetical protein
VVESICLRDSARGEVECRVRATTLCSTSAGSNRFYVAGVRRAEPTDGEVYRVGILLSRTSQRPKRYARREDWMNGMAGRPTFSGFDPLSREYRVDPGAAVQDALVHRPVGYDAPLNC